MRNIISKWIQTLLTNLWNIVPLEGNMAASVMSEELLKDKPSMIARFGSVEIKAIIYPKLPWLIKTIFRKKVFSNMEMNAGFFPINEENIKRFSRLMMEDMKLLDILGSWRVEEHFLHKNFPIAKKIHLKDLEPYFQKDPWTECLSGKKVLVIHPFNTTIENQYFNNRKCLFKDKRILPEFKTFETIRAVQTIAGNRGMFEDWFEALEFMKIEIDKKDFDVAIIGCGAYGFPLAAHVKRIGKKAVHLGGATQILFGIKGKRWLDIEDFKVIINDYFVFPADQDKPLNSQRVEGGCYW